MENKDMPAYPQSVSSNEVGIYLATDANINDKAQVTGITKRELIAATISYDASITNPSYASAISGIPFPKDSGNWAEEFKYWCQIEAFIRVSKADALLAELSKPQP